MKLTRHVELVASGRLGLSLSDDFDCNVYAIHAADGVTLIDSGAGYRAGLLPALLQRAGIDPRRVARVLLTHKHADHSGGAEEIRRLSGAEVFASARTLEAVMDGEGMNARLERVRTRGDYPPDYRFVPLAAGTAIDAGASFPIGDLTLSVIAAPGHCDGHLAFLLADGTHTGVFTGDALLPGGEIVLQSTPDLSLVDSYQTLRDLADLRFDALFPGHLHPSLGLGYRHALLAVDAIDRGLVPVGVRTHRLAPDSRRRVDDYVEGIL